MASYFTFTFCLSKAEKLVWRACGRAPICQKQGGNGDGEPCCQPFCKQGSSVTFYSILLDLNSGQICVMNDDAMAIVFFTKQWDINALQFFWKHVTIATDAIIWIWPLLTMFFDVMVFHNFWLVFMIFQGFFINDAIFCSTNRADVFEVHWPSYAITSNCCQPSVQRCDVSIKPTSHFSLIFVKGDLFVETLSFPFSPHFKW